MADRGDKDRDEDVPRGSADERIRGIASDEDEEFEDTEDIEEEEEEEEGEEGSF